MLTGFKSQQYLQIMQPFFFQQLRVLMWQLLDKPPTSLQHLTVVL